MCDIDSNDIWIKLRLFIDAEARNYVEVEVEVKVDKCMDSQDF